MRRVTIASATVVLALLGAGPVAAQAPAGCAGQFPATVFELRAPAGPVTVVSSDLSVELTDRYAADVATVAAAMQRDIGGLDGVEVCLFPDELPLDSVALGWPEGQRLRAASFVESRTVVLSAHQPRLVRPAAILGLAHQAQWAVSGGEYPATFGSAVAQWYSSDAAGRLDRDHASLRYARIIGSLAEPVPWTAGALEPVMLWDPQFQDSPIGDFVAFAVAAEGRGLLGDPDPATLRRLDVEWRQELLNEARGSDRPTDDWISGVVVVAAVLVLGLSLPLYGVWRKRRDRRPPPAPPPDLVGDRPARVGAPESDSGH